MRVLAAGAGCFGCTFLNIIKGQTIMSHGVVCNGHILPIAQNAASYVTTVVVCQSSLVRSGISQILSGTRFVISEEALVQLSQWPILCLIHAEQPAGELTETIVRLKTRSARVVLLADHIEPAAAAQAIRTGLDGLCSTAMGWASLIKALELVMLGEIFIPAAAGLTLLQQRQADSQAPADTAAVASILDNKSAPVSGFSDREAQILHLLTKGASNKFIAYKLGVAEVTVKVHMKSILRKVKATNRTQAAVWAQEHMNCAANEGLFAAEKWSACPIECLSPHD
jgi:two-component system, NarL family, nitrate/nitrite response regulator NarL